MPTLTNLNEMFEDDQKHVSDSVLKPEAPRPESSIDFSALQEIAERGSQTFSGFPTRSSYDLMDVPEIPKVVNDVPAEHLQDAIQELLMPKSKEEYPE